MHMSGLNADILVCAYDMCVDTGCTSISHVLLLAIAFRKCSASGLG